MRPSEILINSCKFIYAHVSVCFCLFFFSFFIVFFFFIKKIVKKCPSFSLPERLTPIHDSVSLMCLCVF